MLDLGVEAATGCRTVAYAERDGYAQAALLARMEDSSLEPAPVWGGDLGACDWSAFRGLVDVITAGIPCQPHSVAGKQKGLEDERWIWKDVQRAIGDIQPCVVFVENVSGFVRTGGLAAVLGGLAGLGYHVLSAPEREWRAQWGSLAAADVGASHKRERIFVLAYRPCRRLGELWESSQRLRFAHRSGEDLADTADHGHSGWTGSGADGQGLLPPEQASGCGKEGGPGEPERCGPDVAHRPCERGQRRGLPEPDGRDHPADTDGSSNDVGDTTRQCDDRSGVSGQRWRGQSANTDGGVDTIAGVGLADADGEGLQERRDKRGDGSEELKTSQRSRSPLLPLSQSPPFFFAPGPSDPRWPDILANHPHLAPATEPGLCVFSDGLPLALDESRADQLRCAGNGVVALQAATAFVVLLSRAITECQSNCPD